MPNDERMPIGLAITIMVDIAYPKKLEIFLDTIGSEFRVYAAFLLSGGIAKKKPPEGGTPNKFSDDPRSEEDGIGCTDEVHMW